MTLFVSALCTQPQPRPPAVKCQCKL